MTHDGVICSRQVLRFHNANLEKTYETWVTTPTPTSRENVDAMTATMHPHMSESYLELIDLGVVLRIRSQNR